MASRSYNLANRLRQQDELKARIAAAAAQLHAEQGALATSHAQIAQRAGVSLPTVYKHFPTLDELIPACTSHAMAGAPRFPKDDIAVAPDIGSAAELLVEACDALNAYFEPWAAWREHASIDALRVQVDARRKDMRALCEALFARHGVAGEDAAALWETLLSFDTWHRLVREHKLSRAAARRHQLQLLLAALGPQPAARPTPRPRRK
jgi:AcrR family transcriptional regulator